MSVSADQKISAILPEPGYSCTNLHIEVTQSDLLNSQATEYTSQEEIYDDFQTYDQPYLSMPHAYREYIDRVQRFSFSAYRTDHRAYNSNHIREPFVFMRNIELRDLWNMKSMWWSLYGMNWMNNDNFEQINNSVGFYGQRIILGMPLSTQNNGKISYSLSNRTTTNQLKASCNLNLKHGFSMQLAANVGMGRSLSIDGFGRRQGSFIWAINKTIDSRNSLNLLLLAGTSFSGARAAITEEAKQLTGNSLYNPYWGYYGDDITNARGAISYGGTLVLGHIYSSLQSSDSKEKQIRTNLFFNINSYQKRNINWNKAPNPWPDNYRNMPSYERDPQMREYLEDLWRNDKNGEISQINYQQMYNFNARSLASSSGASYILERGVRNSLRASLVSSYGSWFMTKDDINHNPRKIAYYNLELAIDVQYDKNRKILDDLLGGNHWLDVDNFVEQNNDVKELTQSNAFTPNRKISEGQEFGYKYDFMILRPKLNFNISSVSRGALAWNLWANVSARLSQRIGFYHKENFALHDSYGSSAFNISPDFGAGAMLRYIVGAGFEVKGSLGFDLASPSSDNLYINPRYRSSIVPGEIDLKSTISAELSLRYRRPGFYAYGSLYINSINSAMQLVNFYDEMSHFYCHYVIKQMDMRYMGFEASSEVQLKDNLWLMAMMRISANTYTSDPMATQIIEATGKSSHEEKVYLSGKHCGRGAEDVFRLELSYRPRGWLINMGLNVMANAYVDVAPVMYTARTYEYASKNDMHNKIFNQQKLGTFATLDIFCGKTFYLRSNHRLGVYAGINNLTNNRNIRSGGYESARFRQDIKYYYSLGINGFLNISYSF